MYGKFMKTGNWKFNLFKTHRDTDFVYYLF